MHTAMQTLAVVLEAPEALSLQYLPLDRAGEKDLLVQVHFSGISTGTERLLWNGRMPPFPGLGYPLVPGYESVGTVLSADASTGFRAGDAVFVPGARCFGEVKGLFGGAASHLVTAADRVVRLPKPLADTADGEQGVLLALAATAWHAITVAGPGLPDLVIGHGVLGRLVARMVVALGGQPTVWERQAGRCGAPGAYPVITAEQDTRHDYRRIVDVSGDDQILDQLILRLAKGGTVVLAGFYSGRLSFGFPPAFMREASLRVAAEWAPADLQAVLDLVGAGRLSLEDLITHREVAVRAPSAYRTAFNDPLCLKMILDWRDAA